jgi:hypothetical protein
VTSLVETTAAAHRAVRTTIAQELKVRYEVPSDVPPEMLALLMQLDTERP